MLYIFLLWFINKYRSIFVKTIRYCGFLIHFILRSQINFCLLQNVLKYSFFLQGKHFAVDNQINNKKKGGGLTKKFISQFEILHFCSILFGNVASVKLHPITGRTMLEDTTNYKILINSLTKSLIIQLTRFEIV